jgi:hypothetical protein
MMIVICWLKYIYSTSQKASVMKDFFWKLCQQDRKNWRPVLYEWRNPIGQVRILIDIYLQTCIEMAWVCVYKHALHAYTYTRSLSLTYSQTTTHALSLSLSLSLSHTHTHTHVNVNVSYWQNTLFRYIPKNLKLDTATTEAPQSNLLFAAVG